MFIALAVIVGLVLAYVLFGRKLLKRVTFLAPFFAWIEPAEIMLWKKSETILWARLKMVTGILLTVLTQAGSIDITPLMPLIPDRYEGIFKVAFNMLPLTLTVLGAIDERLRRVTTKPLEMVAAPDAMTAPVAAAMAKADASKDAAVAAIEKAAA